MFIFLRNILTGVFSVDDADEEQSKLFGKLSDTNIDKNPIEKKKLKNARFPLDARQTFLIKKIQIKFQHLEPASDSIWYTKTNKRTN